MKIAKAEVAAANLGSANWLVFLAPNDDEAARLAKLSKKITVDPDDQEKPRVEVTIDNTDMLWAVRRGSPTSEVLSKALGNIIPTVTSAVASGGGTPAGWVVNGTSIMGSFQNAMEALLERLDEADPVSVVVPVHITQPGKVYDMYCRFDGTTVTTDWDEDEIANIRAEMVWREPQHAVVEHKNEGLEEKDGFRCRVALIGKPAKQGELVRSELFFDPDVTTDGAFWHATTSAVRIKKITFVFEERGASDALQATDTEPPEESKTEVPAGEEFGD